MADETIQLWGEDSIQGQIEGCRQNKEVFAKLAHNRIKVARVVNNDATHNASRSRHTQLLGWRLFATHNSVNGAQLGSRARVGSVWCLRL